MQLTFHVVFGPLSYTCVKFTYSRTVRTRATQVILHSLMFFNVLKIKIIYVCKENLPRCSFKNLWRILVNFFFKIGGHQSFLWGNRYPCFGLLVMSSLCFKSRVGSLTCMLRCVHGTDSSDSHLVWHLLNTWWLVWWSSHFNPNTCRQALVGLKSWIKHVAASQYVTGRRLYRFS